MRTSPRHSRALALHPALLAVAVVIGVLCASAAAAAATTGGASHGRHGSPVRRPSASPSHAASAVPVTMRTVSVASTRTTTPVAKCLDLGIGSNYQWNGNLPNAAIDLPRLKTYGISTIREDIFWSVVQPDGPTQWNWGQYDRLFTMASQQGVNVLPIIDYGTSWASAPGTSHDMPTSTLGQTAYATYAAAVVARYGPNGTFWKANPQLPPRPFTAVELWNEPWYAGHPVAVGTYVSLLKLAGAAIKAVDPSMTTLANVDDRWTTMTDTTLHFWGQAVLQYASQLTPVIDGWAIHPYSEGQWNGNAPAADAMRQMSWLQGLLVAGNVPGHIWVTEVGFSTAVAAPYTPGSAYGRFLTSVLQMTGPNAPQHVFVFTSSRSWSGTKPGSWDYGFNLVDSTGQLSPELAQIDAARCSS